MAGLVGTVVRSGISTPTILGSNPGAGTLAQGYKVSSNRRSWVRTQAPAPQLKGIKGAARRHAPDSGDISC